MKALLPRYAGKVDCIFIDPPYNTGNENWCYNDNVNSPIMRDWLNSNPVNREDMLRHDKWLAMMWPRLKLLHELLAETGSFWMTLDGNEIHRARMMLDEIFGEENFVATCIWQKVFAPKNTARHFSEDHDYLLVYAKNGAAWLPNLLERTDEMAARFSKPDNDHRGPWTSGDLTARNYYSKGKYEVTGPTGKTFDSGNNYWRQSYEEFLKLETDKRVWWGSDGNNTPRIKRFLSEVKEGKVPQTLWFWQDVGHTQDAKKELLSVMSFDSAEDVFITPKPAQLLQRVLQLATSQDSLILDSFAGSATTAHAVFAQNAKDGGNRKFILVECEDYADTLTAERVRRVINGYDYKGTQKEELYREKITWTNFSKEGPHHKLLQHVQSIENLDGLRFDAIKKEIKDGELIVTGENKITERVAGLGGGFTFYTLGEPLEIDKILTGETLPDYQTLGAWLFHTATGQAFNALDSAGVANLFAPTDLAFPITDWYLGTSTGYHVWLIYRPELDFLKSPQAALTLTVAEAIAKTYQDKPHLVFAAAKYVPNRLLLPLGVEHMPLPFALYRMEKD